MYIPEIFRENDEALALDLVEEIQLGSLVSRGSELNVSHLPFMVDRHRGPHGVLIGHVARANQQWKDLEREPEALATFFGPSAYISPSWYSEAPKAPTWSFVSVHVYGKCRLILDRDHLVGMVKTLSGMMEPPRTGWLIGDLDQNYIDRLIPGIVGFEIDIARFETQLRLSQQNNDEGLASVYSALSAGTPQQKQVAQYMGRFAFRGRPQPFKQPGEEAAGRMQELEESAL